MSSCPPILLLPLLALLAAGVRAEPPVAPAEGDAAVVAAPTAAEQAYAEEQRLAAALRGQLQGGEALALQAAGQEVLAIFTPQTRGTALGAVVLLHDLNANPDQPGLVRELRRQLPDAGWHTLAVQLPHAATAGYDVAQLDAITPRITAALAELERRDIRNIVLIGHGQGGLAVIDYLANNLTPSVRGVVVIGLDGSANGEPRLDAAAALTRVKPPLLDIYGERDYPVVVASAKRRHDLARSAYAAIASDYTEQKGDGLGYRQVRLSGADHHFSGQTAELIKRLRGWLKRHAAGNALKSTSNTEPKP